MCCRLAAYPDIDPALPRKINMLVVDSLFQAISLI
jgi:hypothetical protein